MNQILSKKWVKKSLILMGIFSFITFGIYAFSGSHALPNTSAQNQSELGIDSQNDETNGNENVHQNDKESLYILVGLIVVTALVGTLSSFNATSGRKGYKPYYPNSYRKQK